MKASPDQMLLLSKLEDKFNQLYDSPFDFGTLSSQEMLSMLQYQFQVFLFLFFSLFFITAFKQFISFINLLKLSRLEIKLTFLFSFLV